MPTCIMPHTAIVTSLEKIKLQALRSLFSALVAAGLAPIRALHAARHAACSFLRLRRVHLHKVDASVLALGRAAPFCKEVVAPFRGTDPLVDRPRAGLCCAANGTSALLRASPDTVGQVCRRLLRPRRRRDLDFAIGRPRAERHGRLVNVVVGIVHGLRRRRLRVLLVRLAAGTLCCSFAVACYALRCVGCGLDVSLAGSVAACCCLARCSVDCGFGERTAIRGRGQSRYRARILLLLLFFVEFDASQLRQLPFAQTLRSVGGGAWRRERFLDTAGRKTLFGRRSLDGLCVRFAPLLLRAGSFVGAFCRTRRRQRLDVGLVRCRQRFERLRGEIFGRERFRLKHWPTAVGSIRRGCGGCDAVAIRPDPVAVAVNVAFDTYGTEFLAQRWSWTGLPRDGIPSPTDRPLASIKSPALMTTSPTTRPPVVTAYIATP
ncbi:hypothetical protein IWX90DRAFT_306035 [Phyllosticta citrichinensis]|uniref:Uncharacterized protein n=1 Tax=Phyllosticta citrichinensis TaxID=1130410 RepID=A0ABR1XLU2_9PEZI